MLAVLRICPGLGDKPGPLPEVLPAGVLKVHLCLKTGWCGAIAYPATAAPKPHAGAAGHCPAALQADIRVPCPRSHSLCALQNSFDH